MKKFFTVLLFLGIVIVPFNVEAMGEKIGNVYSTDIIAYINGRETVSYNIGGKTAVAVEDLIYFEKTGGNYGFYGYYDDTQRLLSFITTGYKGYGADLEFAKEASGEIVGNVYSTDIRVTLNGYEVNGYNIGGRTAVVIEDIAMIDSNHPNAEYGFSKYLCKYRYDDTKREIYMDTYIADEFYKDTKLCFFVKDNSLHFEFDQMNHFENGLNTEFSEEFKSNDNFVIMPLYHNSEIIGDMYIDGEAVKLRCDEEKIQNIIRENDIVLSYEEAQNYVNMHFDVISVNEDENALIYTAKAKNDESGEKYLLLAMKNGGFINVYSGNYDDFEVLYSEERGYYLSCYPFGGPHGATVMTMDVDTAYYIK